MIILFYISCQQKEDTESIGNRNNCATYTNQLNNDLRTYYKIIYPNDTTTLSDDFLEKYFSNRMVDTMGEITITSAIYSRGYDGAVLFAIIIRETGIGKNKSPFFLFRDINFTKTIYNDFEYNPKDVDVVLSQLSYLQNISITERNKIISKIVLLSTLAQERMLNGGNELTVKIHQSCADLIELNDQSLTVFKNRLKEQSSINLYYPNYTLWRDEFSICCDSNIGFQQYLEQINEIEERRQNDSAMINRFTNFSKSLILETTLPYIIDNLKDQNKLFFYSVPDFQIYEIDISFSAEKGYSTNLKWLQPRVKWDLPYLPVIVPELNGDYDPVIVE